jgi:predicted dienelactone hydrolase
MNIPTFSKKGNNSRRWVLIFGLLITFISSVPSHAAERVSVQLGPLRHSLSVEDLQEFANTGQASDSLKSLMLLLPTEARQVLNTRLHLDPKVADKLVEDLLYSSAGERFLNTLQAVIPDSSTTQLQQALTLVANQPEKMSVLGFLKSFPAKNITIDVASAATLFSQASSSYWQSLSLSVILDWNLSIEDKPLPTQNDPAYIGKNWVFYQTLDMQDKQRNRTIPIDIYWSADTQGPLVLLSHGFGADRRSLSYLGKHLASHGITVVALEHPGSNMAWLTSNSTNGTGKGITSNLLPSSEFLDRPKDVSFVLDRLDHLNQISPELRGKLNTEEVSIIGHSLGGYTALALTGAKLNLKRLREFCSDPNPIVFSPSDLLQCNAADLTTQPVTLKDSRIKQAIVLNPLIGQLFDEANLAKVQVPILMLASTEDVITPAASQQFLPFTQLKTPSRYLLTAIGATHLSATDPANLNQQNLIQSFSVRERSIESTEPLRNLLKGVSLAFIKQLTPEARDYSPFLEPNYTQSFSSPTLKLRLNSDLPSSVSSLLAHIF